MIFYLPLNSDFRQSCKQKLLPLSDSQNLLMTTDARYSGCVVKDVNGVGSYVCTGGRRFQSSRERWWYVAVSGCEKNFSDVSCKSSPLLFPIGK